MNDCKAELLDELTRWFRRRLDESRVRLDLQALSYDGNTPYDIAFYRLQGEAQDFWFAHYGFVPTPGLLMQAFFNAEYERFRESRLASRNWLTRVRRWLS